MINLKIIDVRVSVNLKKIANVIIECGYKPVLEIIDGADTIRFDSKYKKTGRIIYMTDHSGIGYVKELRKYLIKNGVKCEENLDIKNIRILKMININILADYKNNDVRYLVAKNISNYNSYYSVALVPKTKMLYFYKIGFYKSRELKQSFKEMLAIFNIESTRKIFGIKVRS